MKKSKIFIGAAVLTLGAVVIGRASNKFAAADSIFYTDPSASHACKQLASGLTVVGTLTTSVISGGAAAIRTGTTNYTLFNATTGQAGHACATPLYFKK